MGFFDWLQLLFIALKMTNQIDWPWFQVFIPFWIVGGVAFLKALVD